MKEVSSTQMRIGLTNHTDFHCSTNAALNSALNPNTYRFNTCSDIHYVLAIAASRRTHTNRNHINMVVC